MQRQTRPCQELLIGDDCSSDNTDEVVRSFRDPRIRYFRHPHNIGIYANWNFLVSQAQGDYVSIYHDHDAYRPTILEKSGEILDANPDVAFVHTALVMVDESGHPTRVDVRPFPPVMSGELLRKLLATSWYSPVMAATAMVRRTSYAKFPRYQFEEYGLGCDKHMWFDLAGLGPVGYVAHPQAFIQERAKGSSTAVFDWHHEKGCVEMRAKELTQVFPHSTTESEEARRAFVRDLRRRLLMLSLRYAALEQPADFENERDWVLSKLGLWERTLLWFACSFRAPKWCLRRLALPLYYAITHKAARRNEQLASRYCQQKELKCAE
jgi:hypothetical protein